MHIFPGRLINMLVRGAVTGRYSDPSTSIPSFIKGCRGDARRGPGGPTKPNTGDTSQLTELKQARWQKRQLMKPILENKGRLCPGNSTNP